MKKNFKWMLILIGVFIIALMGCKKRDGRAVVIKGTNLSASKPGTLIGTFAANGAFNTSGDAEMVVVPVGEDSIHCTYTMTAPEGAFVMAMDCEKPPGMTGVWKITSGTGAYVGLRGGGTLVMMFPPDVPTGVISEETMTGEVWWHL